MYIAYCICTCISTLFLQEMIKDFDRSYNEMISGFIEKIQAL